MYENCVNYEICEIYEICKIYKNCVIIELCVIYENIDLIKLADRVVKELYQNKEIYNYVHNGKQVPVKYEKMIQRPIQCSNIDNYKSLQTILTNAIRYSFNQNTQLNTTIAHEYRTYRETCERNKVILSSLKKKKSLDNNKIDIRVLIINNNT
jgi:hypothetical protein